MTKFGMSLKDELIVTISKERFEDFISPFLVGLPEGEIEVTSRPSEGDLIYFPLGGRLFEIKFVEHEKPFYQLGKNYVYELRCELFELEDEVGGWDQLSTTTDEIDDVHNLNMYLDVDGERMQTGNTNQMIFNISQLVSYMSHCMTLFPGDICCTGTPPGVGENRKPSKFLMGDETVKLGIDNLGEQTHKVVNHNA